jgi:hypothetical protein
LIKEHRWTGTLGYAIGDGMKAMFPESPLYPPQIDKGYKVMTLGSTDRSFLPLQGCSVEAALDFKMSPGGSPPVIQFIDALLAEIDRGVDSNENIYPIGYISLRATGRTSARLGMARWDLTGYVEVALLGWPDAYSIVRKAQELALTMGGVLHWGQSNRLMERQHVESVYGKAEVENWCSTQKRLGGKTFTNTFMTRCGLA